MAQNTPSMNIDHVQISEVNYIKEKSCLKQDGNNNINVNGSSSCTVSNGTPSKSNSSELIYDEETIDGYAFLSFNTLDDLLEYQKRDAKMMSMCKGRNVSSTNVQVKQHVSNSGTSDTSSYGSNDTHSRNESNLKCINKNIKNKSINYLNDGKIENRPDEEAETAFWLLNNKTILDIRRRCVPRPVSIVMDKSYVKFSVSAIRDTDVTVEKSTCKSISLLADAKSSAAATPVVDTSHLNDLAKKRNHKKSPSPSPTTRKSSLGKRYTNDADDDEFIPSGRKKNRPEADVASMISMSSRHSKRDIRLPARYHNSGMMIGNQWIIPGPEKVPEKKGPKDRLSEEQKRIQRLAKPSLLPSATSPVSEGKAKQSSTLTTKTSQVTSIRLPPATEVTSPGVSTSPLISDPFTMTPTPQVQVSTAVTSGHTTNSASVKQIILPSAPSSSSSSSSSSSLFNNNSKHHHLHSPSILVRPPSTSREKTILPRKNMLISHRIFTPTPSTSSSSTSSTVTSASTCADQVTPKVTSKEFASRSSSVLQINGKVPHNKIINRNGPTINGPVHFISPLQSAPPPPPLHHHHPPVPPPPSPPLLPALPPPSSSSSSSSKQARSSDPSPHAQELHELYRSLYLENKPERKLYYQRKGMKPRVNKLVAVEEAISVIKKHQKRAKQLAYIKNLLTLWHNKLDLCLQVIQGVKVPDPNPKKDITTVVRDVLQAYQGSVCYNKIIHPSNSPSSSVSETSFNRDGNETICSDKNGSFLASSPSVSVSTSSSMKLEDNNSNVHMMKISEMPSVNVRVSALNRSGIIFNGTDKVISRQSVTSSKPKSVQLTIGNGPPGTGSSIVGGVVAQTASPIPTLAGSATVKKRRAAQSLLLPRKVINTPGSTIVPGAHENHDPTIMLGQPRKDSTTFNSTGIIVKKDITSKLIPPNEPVLSVNGPRVALNNGLMPNLTVHWRDNNLSLHPHSSHLTNPTAGGSATL